jgi:hypothetical protein
VQRISKNLNDSKSSGATIKPLVAFMWLAGRSRDSNSGIWPRVYQPGSDGARCFVMTDGPDAQIHVNNSPRVARRLHYAIAR